MVVISDERVKSYIEMDGLELWTCSTSEPTRLSIYSLMSYMRCE